MTAQLFLFIFRKGRSYLVPEMDIGASFTESVQDFRIAVPSSSVKGRVKMLDKIKKQKNKNKKQNKSK